MSIVDDDSGRPYKVHLCKTDISQNNNKFYDMELLLEGSGAQSFSVKLINGRIGYRGVTNFKYFPNLEKAKSFFNTKFHEKTRLNWEVIFLASMGRGLLLRHQLLYFKDRDEEPVHGKYVVVELANNTKVKKEEPEPEPEPENAPKPEKKTRGGRKKKLEEVEVKKEEPDDDEDVDPRVKELMKCICDEDVHLGLLKQLKFNEDYGKPIDCLSLAQLDTGFQILSTIEAAIGGGRKGR
uniref:Poly [ADP-ribose] polymerase n=1 Tax=Caenorhabditis japonica TaxID=281687 RepID=A0A8R1HVW7_CAEJA